MCMCVHACVRAYMRECVCMCVFMLASKPIVPLSLTMFMHEAVCFFNPNHCTVNMLVWQFIIQIITYEYYAFNSSHDHSHSVKKTLLLPPDITSDYEYDIDRKSVAVYLLTATLINLALNFSDR